MLLTKLILRDILRPSLEELKQCLTSPDLDFLVLLKVLMSKVPIPWYCGRKQKYLQGKRGFEKTPFQLPDFIIKIGITKLRDTLN